MELRYVYSDELYHHGVKGMRWGHRKPMEYHSNLHYKYSGNKKEYNRSLELDKKISNKFNSDSRVKGTIKTLLGGSQTRTTYNMARAAGESRGKSALRAIFDINGSRILSNIPSAIISSGTQSFASIISSPKAKLSLSAAGAVAGIGVSNSIGSKLRDQGNELSLQQRSIRRKYIKNSTSNK